LRAQHRDIQAIDTPDRYTKSSRRAHTSRELHGNHDQPLRRSSILLSGRTSSTSSSGAHCDGLQHPVAVVSAHRRQQQDVKGWDLAAGRFTGQNLVDVRLVV
jgi:hypothetical protein